ncbi:bifunctional adenosylcobinamide kinase/adenosylcobinamide-phosphate guanylyltransferase [Prosthecochloris sp.]|uniref:bifunctional adenosylcobinamide kinase/adenosylcobinamide-phosphate guanylyltransferase n=1 Tax=Prosthecochloris sp. TaxID=290513 RepID=UPI0025F31540|nr:bifunctional adenosylcobinamide kinase/adenosylcobinamide-phosphate guanylyltransferase [Prosthecochloris sp.]
MADVVFLTGGARSGKSSFALQCAERYAKKAFLATAEPFDDEMAARIDKHREERGEEFETLEEPIDIDIALSAIPRSIDVVIIDCLTVWAGNLLYKLESDERITEHIDRLLAVLQNPPCNVILVSNETGMGIVPENAMSRKFRDIAGTINQKVAAVSTEAWLLCSGLPVRLK